MEAQSVKYGFARTVDMSYENAVERVKAALKEEGFGVLAEIDVRRAMQEKLGIDFPKYVILGACNPRLANRALSLEPHVGLLLPCNVVVREQAGVTEVSVIDARQMMAFVGNQALAPVAEEANQRLSRALAAL
jgi:uncharacterized protein (DUF302 family)